MLFNFVGPSYMFPSLAFDAQRSINLYPVKSQVGSSKGSYILCPTPGRTLFSTIPKQPIRGERKMASNGRAFVVAYDTLYEILSDGTYTARGTLLTFSGNVSMSDNGTQLIIVDGTATGGWIYNADTNVYAQITDINFLGGVTVDFIDGYFMLNRPDTGIYQWSDLYDGLTWPADSFANAEGSPDNLTAIIVLHRQAYLIGGETVEVVYNTGESPDPFQRLQGVFIEYGSIAPFSLQKSANSIFFIGADEDGEGIIWQIEGYGPKKISTQPIQNYISQYDISQATSYSYQENDHFFVEWSIPGMPTSIVYDINEQSFHERSRWNTDAGMYERDRANFHMFVFGKHLVSDYENGNIYQQSLNYNMDDDILMRRVRTFPYFSDDLEYIIFDKFQIDMQTGVGLNYDADPNNMNPVINLSWSDDGGNNYSTEKSKPIGAIGQFKTRALWRILGRSRSRIFQASVVANIPVFLIKSHLDVRKAYA